jgi:catechol 2,3-dioxygenase-like lactoylglutathione lyase family enzyme
MPGSVVVSTRHGQKTPSHKEGSLAYDICGGAGVIVVASAVSVTVPGVAASSQFFTWALGFREEIASDGYVLLRRDDAAVDIELHAGEATTTNAAVCLTVTDLLAEYERLRRATPPHDLVLRHEPWGERAVWLTDPNGIAIRLVEWAPPAGADGDRGLPAAAHPDHRVEGVPRTR